MCASVCVVPVQDFSPALLCQFLFRYECYCVSLMERLHSSSGLGNGVCFSDGTTIYGVLWLSPAGLLLHCIPGRYSPDMAQKITGAAAEFLRGKKIYCISGPEAGTDLLVHGAAAGLCRESDTVSGSGSAGSGIILPGLPLEMRRYHLMCRTGGISETMVVKPAGYMNKLKRVSPVPVVQCCPGDEAGLYLLQKEYDRVEVLPAAFPFDERLCRVNLRRALAAGRVYAVPRTGSGFAAKAAISAVSPHFVLIGGVFTLPKYRRRGYAAGLVTFLAENAAVQGKHAVLFVRRNNMTALHAYERAGFSVTGSYAIAYY